MFVRISKIPESKEHEWILSCLHRGQELTVPWRETTFSGTIIQVEYRDGEIWVELKDFGGNYKAFLMGESNENR